MNNVFWVNNIKILIEKDKIKEFVPIKEMSIEEKLNSITRFSLYLSFILSILTNDINYIFIFIITGILTYLIYVFKQEES